MFAIFRSISKIDRKFSNQSIVFVKYFHPPKPKYEKRSSGTNTKILDNMMKASKNLWIVPFSFAFYHAVKQYRNDAADVNKQSPQLTLEDLENMPSIELPEDPEKLHDLTYTKVKLRGYFDHENEILLPNRTNIQFYNSPVSPFDRYGYYVLTPFILENGRRILVNRGWVSEHRKSPDSRRSGQIEGLIELDAFVTFDEKLDAITTFRTWLYGGWNFKRSESTSNKLDLKNLAEQLKIEPCAIFVADHKSTHKLGPIGGQITLPNDGAVEIFRKYRTSFIYLLLTIIVYIIF